MGKIVKNSKAKQQKKVLIEDKQGLIRSLLEGPELKIDKDFSDESLDRKNEALKLIYSSEISLEDLKSVISLQLKEYKPKFPQSFYMEIFRLHGWKVKSAKIYRKSWKVAKITKEIIYGRFKSDVISTLEIQNPYIGHGFRRYKHFQYLNAKGQALLERFIAEATELMSECATWYEFRKKLSKEHGIPYQMQLFE